MIFRTPRTLKSSRKRRGYMLTVFVRSIAIYIVLAFILRLMGKRQVGELEVTELVAALLLSELAAMVIDDTKKPILYGIVPIVTILLLEVMLSFGVTKLSLFKKLFEAKPSFLIKDGKLDQQELGKMRITLEELLGELRLKGVGCIDSVSYAILEQNGQLSVILRAGEEEANGRGIDHPLILDGKISDFNCRLVGCDQTFVEKELEKHALRAKDVFLMTIDDSGKITLIPRKKSP